MFQLEGSKEAKRQAIVILEVLAGIRKPSEAHEQLGVSLPRYYAIEARALQGLITALEERGVRKGKRPETVIGELKKEIKKLQTELNRSQALCRLAQKTAGVKSLPKTQPKIGPKKRKRTREVRARKVVNILREAVVSAPPKSEMVTEELKSA